MFIDETINTSVKFTLYGNEVGLNPLAPDGLEEVKVIDHKYKDAEIIKYNCDISTPFDTVLNQNNGDFKSENQ